MSWFGFGGSKDNNEGSSSSSSSRPMSDEFRAESAFNNSTDFAAPRSSVGAGSSGGSSGSFEQELQMEQQKALVQAIMLKLTDAAFDTCITKPSSSMSSSETHCIQAVVGKYLQTSELIVGRMSGGAEH
jgi:import inner membrane translocase subunit TIM13